MPRSFFTPSADLPDFTASGMASLPAELLRVGALADECEEIVAAWLAAKKPHAAELSGADLAAGLQSLWRLAAVRKTWFLLAERYVPPRRRPGAERIHPGPAELADIELRGRRRKYNPLTDRWEPCVPDPSPSDPAPDEDLDSVARSKDGDNPLAPNADPSSSASALSDLDELDSTLSYSLNELADPAFSNPAFSNPAFSNPAFSAPAFSAPAFSAPAFSGPAPSDPSGLASDSNFVPSSPSPSSAPPSCPSISSLASASVRAVPVCPTLPGALEFLESVSDSSHSHSRSHTPSPSQFSPPSDPPPSPSQFSSPPSVSSAPSVANSSSSSPPPLSAPALAKADPPIKWVSPSRYRRFDGW